MKKYITIFYQNLHKNLCWHFAIALSLFLLSMTVLESKRTTNPYYFDEVSWICNGRVWNELISGRWDSQVWTEDYVQTRNPQAGKYILGFWINAKYGQAGFDAFNCPGWGNLMWIPGLSALTPYQQEILFWGRIPMMLMGALSVGVLYLLGALLFSPFAGIISALILLFSPLFQVSVNRAMPDSPLLLLFLVTILLLRIYQKKQKIPDYLMVKETAFLGIIIGLAVSTKPYGLLLLLFSFIWWFIQFTINVITRRKFNLKAFIKFGINLSILLFSVAAIMFLFNPTFWGPDNTFIKWIPNWFAAHKELSQLDFERDQHMIFLTPWVRTSDFITGFIYPNNWITILGFSYFNIVLLIVGFFRLFKPVLIKSFSSGEFLLLVWTVAFLLLSPLYIHFRFDRYYLPLLPPLVLIESVGFLYLVSTMLGFYKHLRNRSGLKFTSNN